MKSIIISLILFVFILSCKHENKDNRVTDIDDVSLDSMSVGSISIEIRKDPRNSLLFAKRSEAYLREGDIDEAINDIEIALKLDSMNVTFYIMRSEYYIINGKSEIAKASLEKCVRLIPDNTEALLKLAELYIFVEDYKKSFEYLNKVAKIEPHNPKMFFLKGMIYRQRDNLPLAIENLQIAVEKDPDYYDAYILLGLSCAESNDSLAELYYKNAIDIMPNSIEANYDLAIYYQDNNNYEKAFERYNYILDNIDDKFIIAFYNIGYINLEYLKDYDQAISYFTKAIDFDHSYVEAYYNRGLSYEYKGDKKNAILNYKTALKLLTNYEPAIEGLNRIETE